MRLGCFLAAALAAGIAAAPAQAAESATPDQAVRGARVTVMTARRAELVETVVVTGTLVPRDEVLVGPEIEGHRVVEILAEEGDAVKKGQVLARLQRETLETLLSQSDAAIARSEAGIAQARNQIEQWEATLKQSRQQLARSNELKKSGFVSQAVLDQQTNDERANAARLAAATDGLRVSEADLASMQAQRRELQIRLARTEVKSPADGVISRRSVKLGGVASMVAEPMFRIIANGDIELEAEAPETRIGRLSVGQAARISAGDHHSAGKVRLVSPEVDRTTRLGRIRIAVDADSGLRIGSFAKGTVETRRVNGILAPLSAILYGEKGAFIQVVTDSKIVTTPVRLGVVAEQKAEILSGLVEGQIFVAKAGAFLREGDPVTPQPASEADKPRVP